MTTKIDGNNGVLQSYDFQALTTGFSYTFATGTTTLIANPAGTLATGTITMPTSPADGMVITVESTQQVTALTVAANTGQSLVGGTSQLIPNQPLSWIYRLSNTTWYPMAGGAGRATAVVSGTSVASTSGTSIDFTGVPSWVKRVTVMFNGVSTSGTSNIMIQIGDSGGIETTGYVCNGSSLAASTVGTSNYTTGFVVGDAGSFSAAATHSGSYTLSLQDATSNTWTGFGMISAIGQTQNKTGAGGKALSPGPLDRVRITMVNGTDTFDAGSINILYE